MAALVAEAQAPVRRASYLWETVRSKAANWRLAGAGPRVLRWVRRGVPCYWNSLGAPRPFNKGRSLNGLDAEQQAWLEREERRCVDSGAWRRVNKARWVSKCFIIPKQGLDAQGRKQFRLIVDLRPLNLHCKEFVTRYETLSRLASVILHGETVAFLSFDIQDGYHFLQIDPEYQKYFGMNIQGRMYLCSALPFGWNGSPFVFNQAMRTLTKLIRSSGLPTAESVGRDLVARRGREFKGGHALRVKNREVNVMELPSATVRSTAVPWHVLPYCDDYLGTVRGHTRQTRWENAQCFARTSENALAFLGLKRHPRKGQWLEPGQGPEHLKESVDHLGLRVDTAPGRGDFLAPDVKVAKVKKAARVLRGRAGRNRRLVPARQLAGFLGLVNSIRLAVEPTDLFSRAMHDDLSARESWSANVRLSRQSLRDLTTWIDMPEEWNGAPIARSTVTRTVYSDASEFAIGGVLATGQINDPANPGLEIAGPRWHRALTLAEQQQGIYAGEVRALVESIENFAPELAGHTLRFMEDNQAAMYAARKLTTKKKEVVMPLLRRLWALLCKHRIRLQHVDYVRSAANPADEPSRWRFSDEWQLEPAVFQWAVRELGACTIDLFASRNTAQLSRFGSPYRDAQATVEDAWSVPWKGERAWINCDWDMLERVAQRLEEEPAASALIFCPYFPVQSWYQRLAAIADRILVLPFDQDWVCRPQQLQSERIGPASWSACFVSVPARQAGSYGATAGPLSPPVSQLSVEALLHSIELPANVESWLRDT